MGSGLARGSIVDLQSLSSPEDAGAETMEISVNELAARHPNQFMADLTQAMRVTAETAQTATIEQCQADSKAYVEQLRARVEAEELRKAAEADVATIREGAKAQMERVRVETEQRMSRRRELLEQELQEYNSAIELEVERVKQRVAAFETEVGQFFEQLLQGADPAVFASMASQMPDPPVFAELDREALANEFRAKREQSEQTERVAAGAAPPTAGSNGDMAGAFPDHWWMDSPTALATRIHEEEPE